MNIKRLFLIIILLTRLVSAQESKFFNPIEDICWNCIYPIHIAGGNITPKSKDFIKHEKSLCHCQKGLVGLPISYWQPTKLIEVTMTPYKLIAFGGLKLSKSKLKKHGYAEYNGNTLESVYHVHYYEYPVLTLLGKANDFVCTEDLKLSIGYMSEFDPFWLDDSWNNVLYPEVFLFSSPLAISACLADCTLSTIGNPTNKLFWCAGCQGSLYPFTGFVAHVRGAIQASSLLVHRVLAKMHRNRVAKAFEEGNYCEKTYSTYVPKTAYKIQLAQPIKQTSKKCPPLGSNEYHWGFSKTYPGKGEEFTYVIWTRAHCCVDPYKMGKTAGSGGAL